MLSARAGQVPKAAKRKSRPDYNVYAEHRYCYKISALTVNIEHDLTETRSVEYINLWSDGHILVCTNLPIKLRQRDILGCCDIKTSDLWLLSSVDSSRKEGKAVAAESVTGRWMNDVYAMATLLKQWRPV